MLPEILMVFAHLYVMEPNAKMCYSVDDITPMSNITHENIVGFASELKVLSFLMNYNNTHLHIGDTERISTIKINYNTYAFPVSYSSISSWFVHVSILFF